MIGLTSLASGSKGNATLIHTLDSAILIDCGISRKKLLNKLDELEISKDIIKAIFVTHEHSDHISGLRVTSDSWNIPVYCNTETGMVLRSKGRAPETMHFFQNGSTIDTAGFTIEPFSIPHDGVNTVAYLVYRDGVKIGVATDFGFPSLTVQQKLKDCHAMLLECNHDVEMLQQCPKRPWKLKQRILSKHGHLSNDHCLEMISNIHSDKLHSLILGHVSQDTNDYGLVKDIGQEHLEKIGRQDINMLVADQEKITSTVWC